MLNFIVNPSSASGNATKIWKSVSAKLADRKITYNAHLTTGSGSATEFARQICQNESDPTIITIGGDGTVNEVVSGISDFSKVTFGYIPAGSSNDLARDIGLTCDVDKALDAVLNPKEFIMLDIGHVKAGEDEKNFAVSCGVGYDASICHEADDSSIKTTLNKFGLGKLTYVIIALKQLAKAPRLSCTVKYDDNEPVRLSRFLLVTAMNHRYEGGGVMFCPEAKYDDGILDICCAHNMSKLKVLGVLPKTYSGKHVGTKGIDINKAKKIVVTTSEPAPVHADGEPMGVHSEIIIELNKTQLRMILPSQSAK